MKNIQILPTDKPSKVYKIKDTFLFEEYPDKSVNAGNQHIYITSDEELPYDSSIFDSGAFYHRDAAGDIHIITKHTFKPNPHFCKRIILTTDQDLIKDDVQAIDDEFLEWFVNNPSCKFVETLKFADSVTNYVYKIIIPKEEPKQETLEEAAELEKLAMDKLKSKWEHLYTFGYPQKPFPTNYENDFNNVKLGLYEGAKQQAEKMFQLHDEWEKYAREHYHPEFSSISFKNYVEQRLKK